MVEGLRMALLAARLRYDDTQLAASLLMENRVEFLKKWHIEKAPFTTQHDLFGAHQIRSMPGTPKYAEELGKVVDFWAEHDPAPGKEHLGRVLHWYSKGDIRQEDHPRVRAALEDFMRFKPRLQVKDINQYKALADLEAALAPHRESKAVVPKGMGEVSMEQRRAIDQHSKLLHDDEKVQVRELRAGDYEGMSALAMCPQHWSTKAGWVRGCNKCMVWCTRDRGIYADYTRRGPMWWIYDKREREPYLYHPASNQLKDKHDREVDSAVLSRKMPVLRTVLHGKGHHFTDPVRLLHDLRSGAHTEPSLREWMARHTDHSELLAHLLDEFPGEVLSNRHFNDWELVRRKIQAESAAARKAKSKKTPPPATS